jgi:Effector-associated domain 8
VLKAAGVDFPLLQFFADPVNFAHQLVAKFKEYAASEQRIDYHPLIQFLDHLYRMEQQFGLYGLADEEKALFSKLIARGQ